MVMINSSGRAYHSVYDNSRLFQQLGNLASELKHPEAHSANDHARLADFIGQMID
jgi:hypothetical protein